MQRLSLEFSGSAQENLVVSIILKTGVVVVDLCVVVVQRGSLAFCVSVQENLVVGR